MSPAGRSRRRHRGAADACSRSRLDSPDGCRGTGAFPVKRGHVSPRKHRSLSLRSDGVSRLCCSAVSMPPCAPGAPAGPVVMAADPGTRRPDPHPSLPPPLPSPPLPTGQARHQRGCGRTGKEDQSGASVFSKAVSNEGFRRSIITSLGKLARQSNALFPDARRRFWVIYTASVAGGPGWERTARRSRRRGKQNPEAPYGTVETCANCTNEPQTSRRSQDPATDGQ
ncbi:hypothetical protein SKAU_G00314820 [Synaphobranchus kaupii]|uniref:Uncharacterized protein n=1 Tax=Synaphobranchus kaupii TaxID=118154 RepID=A0A9Q1ESC3_SYNKA|nr:hypothetical protein SKAU_G00314820 [Synaphobranchus kaupii]